MKRMFSHENITHRHDKCFELVEMSYKCAEEKIRTQVLTKVEAIKISYSKVGEY